LVLTQVKSFLKTYLIAIPLRKIFLILGGGVIFIFLLFLTIRYLEHAAFQSRIEIRDLKKFLMYVIQNDMNKAVDLGIIRFSLWDGVIVEDLSISSEEDFSFGKKLLHSRKLILKLSSLFSPKPYIRKIRFIEPKFSLNTIDPSFSRLIEYILEARVREVEFSDAQIEVYRGELPYLNWDRKMNWFFRREDRTIYFHFNNGSYWIPWAERIQGQGKIYLDPKENLEILFQAEGKNLDVSGFSGYFEKIFYLSLSEGKITGKLRMEYSKKRWKTSFTYALQNSSGKFLSLFPISFQNLDIEARSEISDDGKYETFLQEFTTEVGKWKIERNKENELYSGKVAWQIPDASKLSRHQFIADGWEVGGTLQGNLSWSETGVKNKWFLLNNGGSSWEKGWIRKEGFELGIEKFHLSLEKPNSIRIAFLGELFHSPWKWDSELELQFRKSTKIDKSDSYPVASKGSISGKLKEFRILDWEKFFSNLYESLEGDRKERMEKLILKDNFTEFPIYRYLLEDMDLNWNFEIETITFPDTSILPGWLWTGSIRQGSARTEVYQKDSGNRIEFYSRFATKLPFLDFKITLSNIPWGRKFSEFCGNEVIVDSFSVDFRGTGMGADTYNITQSAFINSKWVLKGWRPVYYENKSMTRIPEKGWEWLSPSDLSYSWSYSEGNQYYRDMEWLREGGDYLKGTGNSVQNTIQYSFYGKKRDEVVRFSFIENSSGCE